jgi:hypothetical protein
VRALLAVFALAAALAGPSAAIACACCSEPGTWYQFKAPLRPDERAELAKLRFQTANWVQTNEGGPGFDRLAMRATLAGKTWRWRLAGGRTLTLRLPVSATQLAADVHDGKMGGGGGPLLYKEVRLEGPVTTGGILRGTRYRLVLQGRGNNCLNTRDLRSWHLDISGGPEPYSLYGTFR